MWCKLLFCRRFSGLLILNGGFVWFCSGMGCRMMFVSKLLSVVLLLCWFWMMFFLRVLVLCCDCVVCWC